MTPSCLRCALPIVLALLMSACAEGERPRPADAVPPAQSSKDFGNLRVHYNTLPTLSLSEAVARDYRVGRDVGTGMVVVALRRVDGSGEHSVQGQVSAVAYDLQGARQRIDFTAVETGDYTDHIGTFSITPRDSYRFEVTVQADGRSEVVKFQRGF